MTSNLTAGMDQQVANMAALRAIVGPEPREQDLVELLRRYPSVNQAANAFFDGSAKGGLPNVVDGTPISPPPQQTTDMVSVTCPAGVTEGTEIQVQTQQGMMRVTVPKGVTAGTQFLVRLPAHVPLPVAQPVGSSSNMHQYPQYPQYPGQQQTMMMPPQQQRQQNVTYAQQQQQPQVVVVQSAPYMYGGYGYGYGYDPFLGGMMGFAGGMLIADAMFY